MLFIEYNVSGENMDLLKTFLSLFFSEEKSKDLMPLLNLFVENNFNLGKTLSSLDLTSLMPLITSIMSSSFFNKNDNQNFNEEKIVKSLKISEFLDNDVVNRLNSAFSYN